MRRRDTVKYAVVLVAVFGTIICAAEFQDPVTPSPGRDQAALERAREDARRAQRKVTDDASRAGTPWLAP
jgi:hypothetical protein